MKDAIDLANATLLNSADVRDWPITAAITKIVIEPDNIEIEHTRRHGPEKWPSVALDGSGGPIDFTLWFFQKIGGAWYGAAGLEFWETREGSGDSPYRIAADWFYDPNRWGVLASGHAQPGELVGFMVTAGDARPAVSESVHERSAIVTLQLPPPGEGSTFLFDGVSSDGTGGDDGDPPPADSDAHLIEAIDQLIASVVALQTDVRELTTQLKQANEHGIRVHL
jgi:hypothetical protein